MLKQFKHANDLLRVGHLDGRDPSNGNNKCNGISYWKGKKIISFEQWHKITMPENTCVREKLRLKEGLEYFPNDYRDAMFSLGVPDHFKKDVNRWYKDYIELMDFSKNPKFGKRKCRGLFIESK